MSDEMGLGEQGRLIGTITALAESDLYRYSNPIYPLSAMVPNDGPPPPEYAESTANSLGLFQQRPQWWGTGTTDERIHQLMDATISARLFYAELIKVPNWREIEPWRAAQTVQRSEFTDGSNYRARMEPAKAALAGGPRYFTDLAHPKPSL